MSETLLVLGASRYQLDVIHKAKALGYRVATTDNVPSNPGHAVADACYAIDTTDVPAVVALAEKIRPRGVIAPCTDVAVATAAEVAAALGIPGIPPASARSLTSKVDFRRVLAQHGIPTPRFQELDATIASSLKLDGPMVIKPDGSSGSKGVFIVRSARELAARAPETLAFSKARRGVVEELIDGRQATCEGILVDGKVAFHLLTDRLTVPPPFVVTAGHLVPARFGATARARVVALIERIFAIYDVKTTPFDCDLVIDAQDQPWVLELTPRLGGNSLVRLVEEATGVDIAGATIRMACHDDTIAPRLLDTRPVAQLILGTTTAGRFSYDEAAFAALRAEPWIRRLELDFALGDHVEAFINGRTRAGEATIVADSRDDLDRRVTELRSRLVLGAD